MKLKKVVSLALAGVLAVSMLAGCGTKGDEPEQGGTEPTATGYSAKLADIIKSDLDYVSFKDNAADQTALQAAVDGLTDNAALGSATTNTWVAAGTDVAKYFMDKADVKHYGLGATFAKTGANTLANKDMNISVVATAVYATDGSASMDQILKDVGTSLKGYFTKAGSDGQKMVEQGTANGETYDYNYVVSASVVTRVVKTTMGTGLTFNTPVTFIAVTVTRTGTAA